MCAQICMWDAHIAAFWHSISFGEPTHQLKLCLQTLYGHESCKVNAPLLVTHLTLLWPSAAYAHALLWPETERAPLPRCRCTFCRSCTCTACQEALRLRIRPSCAAGADSAPCQFPAEGEAAGPAGEHYTSAPAHPGQCHPGGPQHHSEAHLASGKRPLPPCMPQRPLVSALCP